jgi:hypothetical protein
MLEPPPLFPGRLLPAGTFLGENPVLELRIGLNSDLRNGTLPLGRSVSNRGYRIACPDSGSRLVLNDFSDRLRYLLYSKK